MITINLLPEELKVKPKEKKGPFQFKTRYVLYVMPLVLGVLILTHLYLGIDAILKKGHLEILNRRWKGLEAQRKLAEEFNKEYSLNSQDSQAVQQLRRDRINWSEKLNKISLYLPSGAWLNEISVAGSEFALQGSIISLLRNEMSLITQFIDRLKKDPVFFEDFNNLELRSTQTRKIGSYDITDFVLGGSVRVAK